MLTNSAHHFKDMISVLVRLQVCSMEGIGKECNQDVWTNQECRTNVVKPWGVGGPLQREFGKLQHVPENCFSSDVLTLTFKPNKESKL